MSKSQSVTLPLSNTSSLNNSNSSSQSISQTIPLSSESLTPINLPLKSKPKQSPKSSNKKDICDLIWIPDGYATEEFYSSDDEIIT